MSTVPRSPLVHGLHRAAGPCVTRFHHLGQFRRLGHHDLAAPPGPAARPACPRGGCGLKSSLPKWRFSMSTTARASPMARAAVVLVVGARPRGQASRSTPQSMTTSEPRGQSRAPCPRSWPPPWPRAGSARGSGPPARRSRRSGRGPAPRRPAATMPRSPCRASTGCRNRWRWCRC